MRLDDLRRLPANLVAAMLTAAAHVPGPGHLLAASLSQAEAMEGDGDGSVEYLPEIPMKGDNPEAA